MWEPYWFPLYARAQELGVPLIVHGTNSLDPRYRVVPHNYQLGFLTEQYLAGQFLSHGDVFSRFPELRVIICHCGGALDRFIPTDHHIAQKDLSGNLFYDTCGYAKFIYDSLPDPPLSPNDAAWADSLLPRRADDFTTVL